MNLMHGDLKGTILPLISIDEFSPKSGIDQEVIVIAFYLTDKEPADDLNTFIQRGYFDILDADASPNPDELGRYLVFVEFERNNMFYKTFFKFIKDVENVSGKLDWAAKPYLSDKEIPLHDPDLRGYVSTDPGSYTDKKEYMKTKANEGIKEFFSRSLLSGLSINENIVVFISGRNQIAGNIIKFGKLESLPEDLKLRESAISVSPSSEARALNVMLGENWNVYNIGKLIVLENDVDDEILVVEKIHFSY